MKLNIQTVPGEYLHATWSQVEPFIAAALAYARDDFTVEEARVYLAQEAWQLIVAVDETNAIRGCAVIQYHNRPRDRVAFVIAIGGRLVTNKKTFHQFVMALQHNGATCIEGAVRESMSRFLRHYGFSKKYQIVEYTI